MMHSKRLTIAGRQLYALAAQVPIPAAASSSSSFTIRHFSHLTGTAHSRQCINAMATRANSLSSSHSRFNSSTSSHSLSLSCASPLAPLIFRRHKSCGIVGLPNVGKSTLFNALTDTQLAEASNYPFCTIEPNVANVSVPDPVLHQLAAIAKTNTIIGSQVRFVDIAGIIKGASEGAGLGNKFLQNIRDVDVILHVVRCFEDPQIIHVDSRIDPVADMSVIETELLLADLQTLDKRIENFEKNKKKDTTNPNLDKAAFYKKLRACLDHGVFVSDMVLASEDEKAELEKMQLITAKPMAYICNVDEKSTSKHNRFTEKVFAHVKECNEAAAQTLSGGVNVKRIPRACLRVCSQLESEVQSLGSDMEARKEFLAINELSEGSLNAVIQTANKLLQTIKYYTVGVQEARAWSINVGTNAQQAAGKIHSDLSKGFVCAEVIKPADYIRLNGDGPVRDAGLMKVEGKGYIVQDGDIMLFRVSGQKGR